VLIRASRLLTHLMIFIELSNPAEYHRRHLAV
jgi:hypothetical protein